MSYEDKLQNMSEKELMIELIKSQRRDTRNERVSALANVALVVVLVVALAILIPILVTTLSGVSDTLNAAQDAISSAKVAMEGAQKAMNGVNSVDFEQLNASIANLDKVVSDFGDKVAALPF